MNRILLLLLLTLASTPGADNDTAVLALGQLTKAPQIFPAEGFAVEGTMRPLFYEALPYRGKATRVFAWLGVPANAKGKLPGIVLVHGGGGTAFKEWVRRWNAQGFAAIAIAVEGQTDRPKTDGKRGDSWQRHEWAGPARDGLYGDSAEPLADQWMYHAVADTVLAHALLRSLPEVDAEKVGVMGVSWGGIIVSTVMGIDTRFAFAIPTYGCGQLHEVDNASGRVLAHNALYRELWNPVLHLADAKMPALWFTWLRDIHFPLTAQSASYRAAGGPRMVAVLPEMKHSHPAAWTPPDSYAFAIAVVATGKPWARMIAQHHGEGRATAEFESDKPVQSAVLLHTAGIGFTGSRDWQSTPAQLDASGTRIRVTAPLPPGTTAFFFNLDAGGLTLSSDFAEIPSP